MHFRKRLGLLRYFLLHPQEYGPEIRWFFWGIRLRGSLLLDRMRGRKPLLFGMPIWGHWQFLDPILNELRKQGRRYSFYLALDQQNDLPEGPLLGIERWRVRPYRDYLPFGRRFDALVAVDIAERHPPSPCPLRIYTDHGLPSKYVHATEARGLLYTHIFALGPLHRELWENTIKCHPKLSGRLAICDVGYPKSDRILARRGQQKAIVERFGLDPSLPTVLYAPAFNRGGALERYGRAVFDALASMEDVNVIVKLHPVSYDRSVIGAHSQGIYWPDVVDQYKRSGFCHAGNIDVSDCLIAADVLVTDVSGVAMEYYLLDRPVVYLESPGYYQSIGAENGGGDNWLINVGRPAGVEVKDMPSMIAAIHTALAHPEEKAGERQALRRRLLYNPGHGAEAFVDALAMTLANASSNKSCCAFRTVE